ncbi:MULTISPECIES: PEGA domain-containing protein [Pseudoalteromonas]|jgi:hypothetical protein|uniref:PEGA domain-containing protein n=1 Tax=Pseudoalteromonas aliena SW19 TaxID=1314866 RepID=A0ABR9E461_9GAMM|nr:MULTISPECIES: PEGA domain-containing protein [Pseudoalteromonas]MBB1386148.1 PEGA domain-containing protein [Pseudoalteromonas sp. SG45-5]MBB1395447.1 PEGA domain-containing protein [Pseudoalteromonas sp. SG44-4]MBB1447228.1 PEGA domain-containing protein [Pseudoalteromonas sp. SG41-6]MBE0361332.1 hypothetical protein [Pseudoalteromonas aliena SW19]TMO05389.1 hypothetical protein CWB66_06840 [Pseudoalteromonas sp. S558]
MKKLSAFAAILLLSGCSTTSSVDETEQVVNEVVMDVEEVVAPISLTVIANPADARVRIMNISPIYQDAIELEEGKYDIEVSKKGFITYREWVVVDKKTVVTVQLQKATAGQ